MNDLPKQLIKFIKWYVIDFPRHLLVVFKRIVTFANYEFSFTLNLRLLFTPLFGDYSFVGRGIGFFFRIFFISFGLLVELLLIVLMIAAPLSWYLLPIVFYQIFGHVTLLMIIFVAIVWYYFTHDYPTKKVTEIDKDEAESALKPSTETLLLHLNDSQIDYFYNDHKIQNLRKRLEITDQDFEEAVTKARKTISGKQLVNEMYDHAKSLNSKYLEVEHLFLAYITSLENADKVLAQFSLTIKDIKGAVYWIVSHRDHLTEDKFWKLDYKMPLMGGLNKGLTGHVTPVLDSMATDITKEVSKRPEKLFLGNERGELLNDITGLLGSDKANILIIGEPGSGKTTLIRGLAHKIVHGTENKSLKFKRIVDLEPSRLISGTNTAGGITKKLNDALKEIKSTKNVVLFIDEIHNVLISSGESSDLSSIFATLEPELQGAEIQFIGTTTTKNYRKYIEPNGAFSRLFEVIEVPPASKETTLEILKQEARIFENKYNVTITFPALTEIINLSSKLIHERVFPDKALDVLNRTCTKATENGLVVNKHLVEEVVSELTKIPSSVIEGDEAEKLLNLESNMKSMVIGQDHAIEKISKALKRARTGIRDENRPIASFLFVGTTGVGKTETAKSLAKLYFGDSKAMVRMDMSEYQQQESLTRLLGSPDGSTSGILIDAVRSRPFTLLLLDEIEKAYSSILLTFLQVLDEGRITDPTGREVDFTNTIIIATSNVGTRSIQKVLEDNGDFGQIHEAAMKDVHNHYAPEFLNRFDGIVVYRPLSKESVRRIADLMLEGLRKKMEEKDIFVKFKPELISELSLRGHNIQWGARPLRRLIEDSIETYLADLVLKKEINKGDSIELGLEVFGSSNN